MRRNITSNVLLPILFVAVGSLAALYCVNLSRQTHQVEETSVPIEEGKVEEVVIDHLISEYDPIFKKVGEDHDIDWLLLAAIAKTESVFNIEAESHRGAIGLMQIMPGVAENIRKDHEGEVDLLDPLTNVEVAAELIDENIKMLGLPKKPSLEQWKFVLACYNAGYSRIDDARGLAKHFDVDANDWSIVGMFLSWLSDPAFSELEVVKSGPFYGSKETLGYVNSVINTHKEYSKQIAEESEKEMAKDKESK